MITVYKLLIVQPHKPAIDIQQLPILCALIETTGPLRTLRDADTFGQPGHDPKQPKHIIKQGCFLLNPKCNHGSHVRTWFNTRPDDWIKRKNCTWNPIVAPRGFFLSVMRLNLWKREFRCGWITGKYAYIFSSNYARVKEEVTKGDKIFIG